MHLLPWLKVSHLLFSFFFSFHMFLLYVLQQSICTCQVSCSIFTFYSLLSFLYNLLSLLIFSIHNHCYLHTYNQLWTILMFLTLYWSWIWIQVLLPSNKYPHQEQNLQHKISLVFYLPLNADYPFNQNFAYIFSIMCIHICVYLVFLT